MINKKDLEIKIEVYNIDYSSFKFTNNSNKDKIIKFMGISTEEIEPNILDKRDLSKENHFLKIDNDVKIDSNSQKNIGKININKLLKILTSKDKNYYAYFKINDNHTNNIISYRFMIDNKKKHYFKSISKNFLTPIPFTLSMVSTFIIQYSIANNWINQGIKNFDHLGWLTAILISLIGVDWIYNIKIFDFRKFKSITPLDNFIYWIALTVFFNVLIAWGNGFQLFNFSISWLIVIIGIMSLPFIILIYRYMYIESKRKVLSISGKELVNLDSLANQPIAWKKSDGAILVDERAVDYDLFSRENTKNQLVEAIEHFSSQHAYVVGLVGKWGSGKTTILNNAKKDINTDEYTFIHAPGSNDQDFDLWLFGSQEELINGLYDAFLFNMGIKYNSFWNNKIVDSVAKVVAGIPNIGSMVSPLIFTSQPYKDVIKLKQKLSDYIKSTNKHYVMCIENLDRADDEQVILLLKLLNTVFDLPNTTYVLLYDDLRLKQILSKAKNVNETYKEKVINQEVKIPLMINPTVSKQCMTNLLLSYGFSEDELSGFDLVLNTISQDLSSIRELKIVINSVFSIFAIRDKLELNYPQVLAMQYLLHKNLQLYNMIRKNRELLIIREEQEFEVIDDNTRNKLKELFSDYSAYQNLLENLFPKIKLANSAGKIMRNYHISEEEIVQKSICMPQFFDKYFMLAEDDYVRIINLLQRFNHKLNESTSDEIEGNWSKFIMNHTENVRSQIVGQLNLFITKGELPSSEKREKLSEIMLESFLDKNEWPDSDEYSIRSCVGILIGEVSKKDFNKFGQFISKKYYSKLTFLKSLSSYMNEEGSWGGMTNEFQQNRKRMKFLYQNMQEKCYKKLDIPELIKANNDNAVETIGRLISSKTIYDILGDAFKESTKSIPEIFNKIFNKYRMQIYEIFKKRHPSNSEEKKLYNDYKNWEHKDGHNELKKFFNELS